MFTFGRNSVSGMKAEGRSELEIQYKTRFTIGKAVVQVTYSSNQSITLIVVKSGQKQKVRLKRDQFEKINGAIVCNLESYKNSVRLGFDAPRFIKIDRADKGIEI